MAIHPINAEHRNTPVESSVASLFNAQLIQKSLNPELLALIERYVNQPLLLEKLLLQKNSDALITLKLNPVAVRNNQSNSLPISQNDLIQLKLPSQIFSTTTISSTTTLQTNNPSQSLVQQDLLIGIKDLIELIKSANKISLSLGNNQQIVIKIASSAQPAQSKQIISIIQISFAKSELLTKGGLALSQPLLIKQNQTITNTPQTNIVQTGTVQTLDLNKNLGKIASSLISPASNSSNKLSTDFIQIESINRQLKENGTKISNFSNITKNFIKQIEQVGVQKNVILDVKAIEIATTSIINFIQNSNKINREIQKLMDAITKPITLDKLTQTDTAENTKNLVSRLIKSGNLFENALKQRFMKNEASPLNVSSNTSSKIPRDNKLILNQIYSQLEKLIAEINRYSEKPVTTNQIERIEKSLTTQTKDFTPLEKHLLETNKKNTVQKIQAQQEQLQNVIKLSKSLQVIIKSSIQQIEQNQLHSLKGEQFNLQQFLVDLPIKQSGMIDSFEMRFESQEKNNSSVRNKYWKVVVRFDLKPLGPMFAEIQFENERLSTHIFAEKRETAVLINQHLPTLRKSLFSAGVDVNKISGSQGHIPENLSGQDKASIDTHA